MLVYASNYLDRSIVAVISPGIKADLGLSDTQLGMLKGLAFAVFYSVFSLPVAWLADRWHRVNIIAISIALWSVFTTVAAFTTNFVQLLLLRIGVGIGEAGGVAPGHSLIADYFAPEERARALGFYMLGISLGDAVAFLIGGWVLQEFGWRNVFLVIGIPGLILAAILKLTVREPVRVADKIALSSNENAKETSETTFGFLEGFSQMLRIPSYRLLIFATMCATFAANSVAYWQVDYFARSFDLTFTEITVPMAVISIITFGSGAYLGGVACDFFSVKTKAAYGFVPAAGIIPAAVFGPLFAFAPTPFWAFLSLAILAFTFSFFYGPVLAGAQFLAPIRLRALASSILVSSVMLVGVGLGPLVVGIISDVIANRYGEVLSLKIALSLVAIPVLLATVLYVLAGKAVANHHGKS